MFFFRIILIALGSLRANLMRSLLATLGVIIGVGAVITANAVLEGTRKGFQDQFEALGSNTLHVLPAVVRRGGRPVGVYQTLTLDDVEAIRRHCKHAKAILPEITRTGQAKYVSRNKQVRIAGTSPDFLQVYNLTVKSGRFLEPGDVQGAAKVAVLGHDVARELFGEGPAPGHSIKLGTNRAVGFKVIGELEEKGEKSGRNIDELILVPVTTAQRSIVGNRHLDSIMVQCSETRFRDSLKQQVKKVLRGQHRIRSGRKDDFQILDPQEVINVSDQFMTIMGLVLYIISGISLAVGGIGIMNIMLVSVTERTREIGVRMAVGARGRDILKQFLIESSTISFAGGALGVLLGLAISDLITQLSNKIIRTHTTPTAIVTALVVAIVVGVVSGMYPAYKASKLDPVEALRYE